jgi:hypothetical protein
MEKQDTGLLLNKKNIELQRNYFKEMTKLLGIQVVYRAPRENKSWDRYGELDTFYYEPIAVGCIFEEHPTVWTMKKLGWNSEQNESMSVIYVPYDLEKLQVGALFIIPSGIDNSKGRLFRVVRMSTTMIYPSSISCMLAPEYENTFEKGQLDHEKSDFNLLNSEE